MKVRMSFDDFDKVIKIVNEEIEEKAGDHLPTREDLDRYVIPELDKFVYYLIWIDETGIRREDNADVFSYVRKILTERLIVEG